jgi:hypothetical protein
MASKLKSFPRNEKENLFDIFSGIVLGTKMFLSSIWYVSTTLKRLENINTVTPVGFSDIGVEVFFYKQEREFI